MSGTGANDQAEDISRGQKRSLTGRRRDGSATSSRRSDNAAAAAVNEKASRPAPSGQQAPAQQTRAKKKGGFLSFLNCCGAPDESHEAGQQETPQPAKQPQKLQPTRAKQPSPARQQQNVSAPDTSASDSKDVIDEKATNSVIQPPSEPPVAAMDNEKAPQGDATTDKPVSGSVAEAPSIMSNPEVRPLEEKNADQMVPEEPTTGSTQSHNYGRDAALAGGAGVVGAGVVGAGVLSNLDTSNNTLPSPQNTNPDVMVQAPTPVVPQEEDQMIADRTPEQQARDTDIEMTDVGPSIPLSTDDVSGTTEEESHQSPRRESSNAHQVDLPPPPPLAERQAQIASPATNTSQDTSLVSTPEPAQKWLLPPIRPEFRGRKCLVLDLDETLVHSSFKVSFCKVQ